jgi:hypothetical protein
VSYEIVFSVTFVKQYVYISFTYVYGISSKGGDIICTLIVFLIMKVLVIVQL